MMTWRRQLSRHYAKRDLKCFMGILMVLVTTVVALLIRSQYRHQDVGDIFELGLDNGAEGE